MTSTGNPPTWCYCGSRNIKYTLTRATDDTSIPLCQHCIDLIAKKQTSEPPTTILDVGMTIPVTVMFLGVIIALASLLKKD